MKIYLVLAHYDYENTTVLKAFKSETEADVFTKSCTDYKFITPEPDFPGDFTDDIANEKYKKEETKWRGNHPAGEHESFADSYYTQEIELE